MAKRCICADIHLLVCVFPRAGGSRDICDRVRGNQAFVIEIRYGRSKLPSSYTSEVSFFALRGSLMIVEFSYLF